MFGIALGTLLSYGAAALGGGVVGAWFHNAWLKAKAAAAAEEATLKSRVAALEAALKPQAPKPPASGPQ